MNAVDSSVIVAAAASWHEAHAVARRVLERGPALIAHCGLEAYSVLTRLPPPNRAAPDAVATFLEDSFPDEPLILPLPEMRHMVGKLAAMGVSGGATYDGLVALTALHHGATLVSLDRRATATYRAVGVDFRLASTGDE